MNKLRLSIIAIILFSSTAYARNNNSNINEKIESIIKNGLEMSKKMNQLDNHENKNWRSRVIEKQNSNISKTYQKPTWSIADSNDVKLMICTDTIHHINSQIPVMREFHFSHDGRLLSISEVKEICFRTNNLVGKFTNDDNGKHSIQDQPR